MQADKRAERRRKKIESGELPDIPIQWGIQSSALDRCPRCGEMDMWYIKQRDRFCPKCEISFRPAPAT